MNPQAVSCSCFGFVSAPLVSPRTSRFVIQAKCKNTFFIPQFDSVFLDSSSSCCCSGTIGEISGDYEEVLGAVRSSLRDLLLCWQRCYFGRHQGLINLTLKSFQLSSLLKDWLYDCVFLLVYNDLPEEDLALFSWFEILNRWLFSSKASLSFCVDYELLGEATELFHVLILKSSA